MDDEDLFLCEVLRLTKLTKSTLYQYMRSGSFPPNRKSGKRACWLRSEVMEWRATRPVYRPRPKVVRGQKLGR